MAEAAERPLGIRDVLRFPDLRRLVVAQAISDIGDAMTLTGLLLLVNELTRSTAALAAMSIVLAVPAIVFGLVAGAFADRHDRRRIMLVSDTVRAGLVVLFVLVATVERLPVLYALALGQAVVGAFFSPARGALIPRAVPPNGLMAANAINQTSRVASGVVGTGVTGLLAGLTGEVWPVFLLDALTFLVSVAIVLRVDASLGRVERAASGASTTIGGSVGEGLRLIASSGPLLATLIGTVIALLGLGAVNVLFLPLVVNDLAASPAWLGAIELSQVSSMILAGGIVAWIAVRLRPSTIVTVGLAGVGAAIALLAAAANVWHVMFAMFAVGWFLTPLQAAMMTIVQTAAGDAARGRVVGALQASMSAAQVVSMAAAGVFADLFTIRDVFLAGGLLCLAGAVVAAALFRSAGPTIARGPERSAPEPVSVPADG